MNFIRYQKQSATALSKVAGYISQEQKTTDAFSGQKFVSGIHCSPSFAVNEFKAARTVHHKNSPVWFYHYTQSFSPEEPITGEQAHELAKEFAEKAWPDSQILVATHVDREHIHSHFVVNSVCYESGYMLRQGPTTLKKLRKLSDEICVAHGFSVLPPDPPKHSKQLSTREYRSMDKNQSWKLQLMIAIEDAMAVAHSREHFIKLLARKGYKAKCCSKMVRKIIYLHSKLPHFLKVSLIAQTLSATTKIQLSLHFGGGSVNGNICVLIMLRSVGEREKSRSAFLSARPGWKNPCRLCPSCFACQS